MEVIEFKARIRNGCIRIPEKYQEKTGGSVKVIIISKQKLQQPDVIDQLLDQPVAIKDFSSFSREEIYERI